MLTEFDHNFTPYYALCANLELWLPKDVYLLTDHTIIGTQEGGPS